MGENISRPISTVRGLQVYMPNLWPFIVALVLMLIWVILNLFMKYALAVFAVLYKLVDTLIRWFIPGLGVLALAYVLSTPTIAHAQATPTPTPPPAYGDMPNPSANAFMTGGGGLPGPAPIPPPNPENQRVTKELWEIDNLRGMVSMVQTVWALADQNWFVSGFISVGMLLMIIAWIVSMLRERSSNL